MRGSKYDVDNQQKVGAKKGQCNRQKKWRHIHYFSLAEHSELAGHVCPMCPPSVKKKKKALCWKIWYYWQTAQIQRPTAIDDCTICKPPGVHCFRGTVISREMPHPQKITISARLATFIFRDAKERPTSSSRGIWVNGNLGGNWVS